MRFKPSLVLGLGLVSCSLLTNVAQAAPITGMANIAGNVSVTFTSINFNPSFVNTAGAMETGAFAGLTGGTIMSLTGGPATGATNVPNFAMFTTGVATPVVFDLTFISPGSGTLAGCGSSAVGSLCTPTGSPFTLLQLTSSTVVATLQLNGDAYTGTAATGVSPTTAVFSTQLVAPGTIPTVLAQLAAGGVQGITYSASFISTNPVPEPASMLLFGVGLIGAGLVARRKINS
ncbi:MAG: PEP-CTERM sorting domain-containing protein [Bryobacteraceae bacterium]